jgi:hypothetical protein
MSASRSPFNSSGGRHRRRGSKAGRGRHLVEDQVPIVPHSITEDYVDRVMGCLASGPDLLENWMKEHRKEGKRDR